MKRLLALLALACAAASSFGATLNPIQLLNPAGSTSGQAIVSTGASSAPAWGGIGVNGIAAIAANTVLANGTGSSASPTAFAMPSCSTSASALNWTMSTGFTCNTGVNAATLGGNAIGTSGATVPLLNGANTWSGAQTFTSTITPSQTAGIVGTTTNNSAQIGSVGESGIQAGSGSISTATNTNLASISLTAGDWDVTGYVNYAPAGGASVTNQVVGVSTTSATLPSVPLFAQFPNAVTSSITMIAPTQRITLTSTTTVFLVGQVTFSTGTCTYSANIKARRPR